MGYIDKLDWHFDSAIEQGQNEDEAEKGIANYMGTFMLICFELKILEENDILYYGTREETIKKYLGKNTKKTSDFFSFYFDTKISEDFFKKEYLGFIKKYYDNEYLDDFYEIFEIGDEKLLFPIQKIETIKYNKLRDLILKKYNKSVVFFGEKLKKEKYKVEDDFGKVKKLVKI